MNVSLRLLLSVFLLQFLASGQTKSALEADPSGWTELVSPTGDLKSWSRVPMSGNPKLDPQSQWSVDPQTRYLVCSGDRGHEWLRYNQEFRNFVLHVEWRFVKVEGNPKYNSGVFVRNSEDGKIWHQAQCGPSGGYIFAMTPVNGILKRIDLKDQMKENRVHPAGEWNAYEVTANSDRISLWVNGDVTSVLESCEVLKGYVGVEAEGARIEFRNMRIKELP
jgi:hypothetical protein